MEKGISLIILKEGLLNGGFKRAMSRGFASVLGQLCSEVITYCLYPQIKCSCKLMKISKNFHQGAITIAICFGDFAFVALKLEKVGPMFSRFNPYSLLPSVATDDSLMLKETVSMLKCSLRKQNWIVIFGIQLMGKQFQFFEKIADSVTQPFKTLCISYVYNNIFTRFL